MIVKKFVGANSRVVMRRIRSEMGPEAMILSNRPVEGGIEFLALMEEDIEVLAKTAPVERVAASVADDHAIPMLEPGTGDLSGVMGEIRSMRNMLETQLVDIAWGASQKLDYRKVTILRETLGVGFSPALARYLSEHYPAAKKSTASEALEWTRSILVRNLRSLNDDSELLATGGVFALVGPTGVGKTTTTAKLAARFVMKHGPGKLALITTDNYRIAGHEQLRTYGRLLGVMVHTVQDEIEMRIALEELSGKHTVLIDTVGMSQRDKRVEEQIAMLRNANTKRLLCLNATGQVGTLDEVAKAYGEGLTGVIITKLDEAASLGNILDVIIRRKIPLFYAANGQRVPEDLILADGPKLLEMAFNQKKSVQQFHLQENELTLLMAHANPNLSKDLALEGTLE